MLRLAIEHLNGANAAGAGLASVIGINSGIEQGIEKGLVPGHGQLCP
jgi:hypothetical protein